jgi:UrcA family protein
MIPAGQVRETLPVMSRPMVRTLPIQENAMKKHSALLLLIASSLGVTAGSAAVIGPDTVAIQSETVRYDATEIRDARSARDLFFRIRQAAEEVCRISSFPRGHEIWYEHDCEAAAVEQAVRDADLPALDAYYFRDRDDSVRRR